MACANVARRLLTEGTARGGEPLPHEPSISCHTPIRKEGGGHLGVNHVRTLNPRLVAPNTAFNCVMKAPLFRGLSLGQCAEIASASRERHFSRRQTIFREDDPVRSVFVVVSGRAKITQVSRVGKEVILRVDSAGAVLGGIGLSAEGRHSLSALAIEPCRVLTWPVREFESFAERFPNLRRNAADILAGRLRMLEERFRDLATERVPQRLARILIGLLAERVGPERSAPVGLSCEELAQMAGTTLFTVSRLLCDWAERGIIQPERKVVLVSDLTGLIAVAEGTGRDATGSMPGIDYSRAKAWITGVLSIPFIFSATSGLAC